MDFTRDRVNYHGTLRRDLIILARIEQLSDASIGLFDSRKVDAAMAPAGLIKHLSGPEVLIGGAG
jgi:hypothetical protein